MIAVNETEIRFSLLENKKRLKTYGKTLVKPLEAAHVCPRCGVLVQALYRTGQRFREESRSFFGQELRPAQLTEGNTWHKCQPKYDSYWLTAGMDGAEGFELLRERSHWGTDDGVIVTGACPMMRSVYVPGEFALGRQMAALWRAVGEWSTYANVMEVHRMLQTPPSGTQAEMAAMQYSEVAPYVRAAQDVTGRGSPVWLLQKADWNQARVTTITQRLRGVAPEQDVSSGAAGSGAAEEMPQSQ